MSNLRKVIKISVSLTFLVIAILFYLSRPFLIIENIGRNNEGTLDLHDVHGDIVLVETFSEENKSIENNSSENRKDFKSFIKEDYITHSSSTDSKQNNCSTCIFQINNIDITDYEIFAGNYSLDKEPFVSWVKQSNKRTYCDDKVQVFNNIFAILHDVKMYPSRRANKEAQAKGGEEIRNVLNQPFAREDFIFDNNFFEVECSSDNGTKLESSNNRLLRSVSFIPVEKREKVQNTSVDFNGKYVVAVRRQDYANLHNWVRNIYNIFVLLMHFKVQPKDISVLFMDGHPRTELDNAWGVIYNRPFRVGHFKQTTKFKKLILGVEESKGPITNFTLKQVTYLEEFRSFVLTQFNLNPTNILDCARPRITVILRRNAVYHPRNLAGNVGRKIFNEPELINDIMKAFPRACVVAELMEALPMWSQLNLIKSTDILIGMHGAGMSHAFFLPKHAGILELFAKDFKTGRPWFVCFEKIAKWRNLHYDSWENFDKSLEMPADFTVLPVKVVVNKAQGLMDKICPKKH